MLLMEKKLWPCCALFTAAHFSSPAHTLQEPRNAFSVLSTEEITWQMHFTEVLKLEVLENTTKVAPLSAMSGLVMQKLTQLLRFLNR